MDKKLKLGVIGIILMGTIVGGFVGVLFYAANNVEYEIKDITVHEAELSGTILNLQLYCNLSISADVWSGSGIKLSAEDLEFEIEIDGVAFGNGNIGEINLIKTPTVMNLDYVITLGYEAALVIGQLVFLGTPKEVKIILTHVKSLGIEINKEITLTTEITQEDIADELDGSLWTDIEDLL